MSDFMKMVLKVSNFCVFLSDLSLSLNYLNIAAGL